MRSIIVGLFVCLSLQAARPVTALSVSSNTVTSGNPVTFTYSASGSPAPTCANSSTTTRCKLKDTQGNVTTINSTSGTVNVTPTGSAFYFFQVTNSSTVGLPTSGDVFIPVFVGSNTLSLTTSVAPTKPQVGEMVKLRVVISSAGCGSYPGSACTGLTAHHNPTYDVIGYVTFTGQTSGKQYPVRMVYCGGSGGSLARICPLGGNEWEFHWTPPTAETFTYSGWVGTNADYKAISGSIAVDPATTNRHPGPLSVFGTGNVYAFQTADGHAWWPLGYQDAMGDNGRGSFLLGLDESEGSLRVGDLNTTQQVFAQSGFNLWNQGQPPSIGGCGGPVTCATGQNSYYYGTEGSAGGLASQFQVFEAVHRSGSRVGYTVGPAAGRCSQSAGHFLPDPCDVLGDDNGTWRYLQNILYQLDYMGSYVDFVNIVYDDGGTAAVQNFFDVVPGFIHLATQPFPKLVGAEPADSTAMATLDFNAAAHPYFSNSQFPNSTGLLTAILTNDASYRASAGSKPTIWGEGGNSSISPGVGATESDHPVNERMVIMTWGSWHDQVYPTWWRGGPGNGRSSLGSGLSNFNLGTQERAQAAKWRSYADDFDPLASAITVSIVGNCGGKTLKGLAIGSKRDLTLMVFNETDRNSCASASVSLNIPAANMQGAWYDASTGATLSTLNLTSAGTQTITLPTFTNYVLLRLRSTVAGPLIKTVMLPDQLISRAGYSQCIAAQGGTGPYTFAVTTGALPHGMSLNASTGCVTGTPDTAGVWQAGVTATDSANQSSPEQLFITTIFEALRQDPNLHTLGPNMLSTATNKGNDSGPMIIGGFPPVSCALTGTLPTGIATNGNMCGWSGSPTQTGTFNLTATATDGLGNTSVQNYTMTVSAPPVITQPFAFSSGYTVGIAAQTSNIAPGGDPGGGTITWSYPAGSLPAGMTITTNNGLVGGTPTTPGHYNLTIRATDTINGASVDQPLSVDVYAAVSLVTNSLSAATVGTQYYTALSITGGTPRISCIVTDGYLPAGIILHDCILSGMPQQAGTYAFTIQTQDAIFSNDSKALTLTVNAGAATYTIPWTHSGGTQTNRPWSFGGVIKQGEIANCPQVIFDGTALATQADAKQRWADGSWKHGVLATILPSIANGSHTITFQNQVCSNVALTRAQMLDTTVFDFGAHTLYTNGSTQTADARAMLSDWDGVTDDGNLTSPVHKWTSGPIAQTVILARDDNASTCNGHACSQYDLGFDANKSIRSRYEATFWATGQIFVRFISEISNTETLQDQAYSLALTTGNASPATVYTKASFTHSALQRWTKGFWIAGDPTAGMTDDIDMNLAYLASTKTIYNYDTSLTINPATVSSNLCTTWNNLSSANKDIGAAGLWDKTSGAGGGASDDIGPLTDYTTDWAYTGSNCLRNVALGQYDLGGGWPVHVREGKTGKILNRVDTPGSNTGLGHLLSISGRPSVNGITNFNTSVGDQVNPVGTVTAQSWNYEPGHAHAAGVYEYYLTGDPWYLEEAWFWAGFSASNDYHGTYHRGPTGAEGTLNHAQLRTASWELRDFVQSYAVSPDASPEKTYFQQLANDGMACEEGLHNITTGAFNGNPEWLYCNANSNINTDLRALLFSGYNGVTQGAMPPLHQYWGAKGLGNETTFNEDEYGLCSGEGQVPADFCTNPNPVTVAAGGSLFEYDYWMIVVGRAKEVGFQADALETWGAAYFTGMLTDPGFNPYLADNGRLPVIKQTGGYFTTFADLLTGYQTAPVNWHGVTSFHYLGSPDSFLDYMTAAVSFMKGETNGTAAWNFVSTHGQSNATRAAQPKWALVPRSLTPVAPTITTTCPLPAGTVGVAYSFTAAATGDTPFTWTNPSGALPTGISMTSGGVFSGTPSVAGTASFGLQASNAVGASTNGPLSCSLLINAAATTPGISLTPGLSMRQVVVH
jgi:hypothetical protein